MTMTEPVTNYRTIVPGDYVSRLEYPAIAEGRVLAVRDDRAFVVGRTTNSAPYRLIETSLASLTLNPAVSDDVTIEKIGEAYVEKAALIKADYDARVAEVEALRDRVQEAEVAHEAFRKQVVDTAMEYARRHDWCSVVQSALEEMGLTVTRRYRVRTWVKVARYVDVEVESTDASQAWRDVENMDSGELEEAIAGESLPSGWEHDAHDASTSDVEEV